MEDNKKDDRLSIIKNIILVTFLIILVRILYLTTLKYDHYSDLANNKTYKELVIKAPRGEIRDTYGRLIAGNKNLFTVQVSGDGIKKEDENGKSMANEISLELIKILEENNEEYVDEFPIKIEANRYYYTYDENIKQFKKDNNIPQELDAKESFYYIVDREISNGILQASDRSLDKVELQSKLNKNQIYPPILVSNWMFTEEKNKQDWLASYKIDNMNINAKSAFKEIRNSKSYQIDTKINDKEARKILVVRDLIKSQGYSQYNPVTIAKDISQETMSQIEERAMDLPGVYAAIEPERYYPDGELAFHALGYIGKIPYNDEASYLDGTFVEKYAKEHPEYASEAMEKSYSKNDMVGRSGIEQSYEVPLRGVDGYKRVQVDALGRITKELEVVNPVAGDTVYLTIDKELQKNAEKVLEDVIKAVKYGSTYESVFGNRTISKAESNVESGAVIAIDVKTGDVLAMASYPTFDPNKFVRGMSSEDYDKLNPTNMNDSLAGSAQQNLVTQGVFQPGSIFKPLVGMAAVDSGVSPNYAINDPGVVFLGDRPFADLIWHKSRSTHGYTDLYKALQESCNVYFYTLGSGKNYANGPDPSVNIGPEGILEYAKLFGLDEKTGLNNEMYEKSGKVPKIEDKLRGMKALLRQFLNKEMANDFIDITKENNPQEYQNRIEEIVSWADEPKTIDRVEAINRLSKMKIKENRVEPLADKIVFDYLNFTKWSTADTFNLSIGQGENQYTPAQMVRYTAAIANGGSLVELSTVDRTISSDYETVVIDKNAKEKIPFSDSENLNYIKEGMRRVVTDGTAEGVFATLPITAGAKTGTAEKSGKIPTANEVEYLESHMGSYGISLEDARKVANQLKAKEENEKTEERKKEIKKLLENKDLDEEEKIKLEEELAEGAVFKYDKSNDKANSYFLRQAILKLNPKMTK